MPSTLRELYSLNWSQYSSLLLGAKAPPRPRSRLNAGAAAHKAFWPGQGLRVPFLFAAGTRAKALLPGRRRLGHALPATRTDKADEGLRGAAGTAPITAGRPRGAQKPGLGRCPVGSRGQRRRPSPAHERRLQIGVGPECRFAQCTDLLSRGRDVQGFAHGPPPGVRAACR